MPVVRDQDNQMYIRQWSGGIMLGYFELNPKPCFHDGVPDSFEFQLLPEDWEHCGKYQCILWDGCTVMEYIIMII